MTKETYKKFAQNHLPFNIDKYDNEIYKNENTVELYILYMS